MNSLSHFSFHHITDFIFSSNEITNVNINCRKCTSKYGAFEYSLKIKSYFAHISEIKSRKLVIRIKRYKVLKNQAKSKCNFGKRVAHGSKNTDIEENSCYYQFYLKSDHSSSLIDSNILISSQEDINNNQIHLEFKNDDFFKVIFLLT